MGLEVIGSGGGFFGTLYREQHRPDVGKAEGTEHHADKREHLISGHHQDHTDQPEQRGNAEEDVGIHLDDSGNEATNGNASEEQ